MTQIRMQRVPSLRFSKTFPLHWKCFDCYSSMKQFFLNEQGMVSDRQTFLKKCLVCRTSLPYGGIEGVNLSQKHARHLVGIHEHQKKMRRRRHRTTADCQLFWLISPLSMSNFFPLFSNEVQKILPTVNDHMYTHKPSLASVFSATVIVCNQLMLSCI